VEFLDQDWNRLNLGRRNMLNLKVIKLNWISLKKIKKY